MCPTPPAAPEGPEFHIDGASKGPPELTEKTVSSPTPHVVETTTRSLLHLSAYVSIFRYVTEGVLYERPVDRLEFRTSAPRTSLLVTQGENDTIIVDLNHQRFHIRPANTRQIIEIHTSQGDDTVYIASAFKNPFHIETGAGNDTVITHAKKTNILTGAGNDMVLTGSGRSYVNTGVGNDIVNVSGSGTTSAYLGSGADFFRGDAGRVFVDGGKGDDLIIGGQGHNILSGNDGDDLITAGPATNVIYTGDGQNIIDNLKASDRIYTGSQITSISEGAYTPDKQIGTVFKVTSQPLSETGLIIEGSDTFTERVQDDLRLLLGSDNGHQLLRALTKSIRDSKKPITIREFKHVRNGLYVPTLNDGTAFAASGKPGTRTYGGTVFYNPTYSESEDVPLAALYHELCHAYNFVTGSVFGGMSPDGHGGTKSAPMVNNLELQVVGLPCNIEPFDFDDDPATPARVTNPTPYTENALLGELGLQLRKTYIYYAND
ncbi:MULTISPECIES: M91 family zinc metallopeptidase [unclassified Pseudomonas]|uniref:M91 family zinc metallopeptidase n=1 Tax=unclassified Pseudomonas TaxID=196821 RepID=UPI001476481F|nr:MULTISPECIES: M91 family zinc metallopeptidase [unclassified Pseudomonas]NMY39549.1 hypothetical protein [Pseudomonas sp. WS 5078]NMY62322.1 hypothetical protein [Pseudomonas sp. WS 5354]